MGNHQPGNQACQTCGSVMVIRHTDRNAHCEQEGDNCAVDQRQSRLGEEVTDHGNRTRDISALHNRRAKEVADTG